MVAAVDAVHEGDQIAGAVRQPHAQHVAIERDRLRDVPGEQQNMREPARLHSAAPCCGSARSGGRARRRPCVNLRLLVGRAFLGHADFDERAVRIAEPQPVGLEALGRIEPVDAHALQPLAEARHVVLEGAERDVVQLLARTLGHGAPAVRMAVGVEAELAALFLQVEAEQAIELLGLGHVGHQQGEMIERMHAELAGTARHRLGHGADLGHGSILFCPQSIHSP